MNNSYGNDLKKMNDDLDRMINEIDKKIEEVDNLSEERLREIINELKQGEYIKLSEWYGGRKQSGFSGLIINLDNYNIYQYTSSAYYDNGIASKNSISYIGSLTTNGIKKIEEYFDNNNIFAFNKVEKSVMDAGTSIEIKYKNIENEIVNGDRKYSNNKLSYYDDLLEIVNNNKTDKVNKEKNEINIQIYDDLINDIDNRLKELEENEKNSELIDDNELKRIIEEVVGNDDPFWNLPVYSIVKKIIELPVDTETSISLLLKNENYSNKELFYICHYALDVCNKAHIKLHFPKLGIVGLMQNIRFVKK